MALAQQALASSPTPALATNLRDILSHRGIRA
jgi:hypothetical protein